MYYMHVTNVSVLMCTKALMTKVNSDKAAWAAKRKMA